MLHYLQKRFSKRERTFFKAFMFVFALELFFVLAVFTIRYIIKLKLFFSKSKAATVYFDLTSLKKEEFKFKQNKSLSKNHNIKTKKVKAPEIKTPIVKTKSKPKEIKKNKAPVVKAKSLSKNHNIKTKKVKAPEVKTPIVKTKSKLKEIKKNKTPVVKAKAQIIKNPAVKTKSKPKEIKIDKSSIAQGKSLSEAKIKKINKKTKVEKLNKELSLDLSKNLKEFNLEESNNVIYYAQVIKKEIYNNWRVPKGLNNKLKIELKYYINGQGKAEEVVIVKSSGKRSYDQLLKAAIYRSKFPKSLANLNIIIRF